MHNFWEKSQKPILALAPMAGYSDSAFRQICREFGADVVYSEMISVDGICYDNQKTMRMLWYNKKEYPLIFQLFGSDPDKFKKAVRIITRSLRSLELDRGRLLLGLDINFGCPAHKVTKTGSGASLMDEAEKAYKIIKAVCDNTDLPVSIKIRTKVKNTAAEEFIKKVKDLPWTTVMIHGRTLNQGFAGEIDYAAIKKIKNLLPDKIVLANGGITDSQSAVRMLKKTGADGLGIARGALGNPWIFKKISDFFVLGKEQGDESKDPVDIEDNWNIRKKTMLRHAGLFLKNNDSLIMLRKHLVHYVKSQKNASELRQKLIKVKTLAELDKIIF